MISVSEPKHPSASLPCASSRLSCSDVFAEYFHQFLGQNYFPGRNSTVEASRQKVQTALDTSALPLFLSISTTVTTQATQAGALCDSRSSFIMRKAESRSASHVFDNINDVALPPRKRKAVDYNVDRALKDAGSVPAANKGSEPVRKAKRKNTVVKANQGSSKRIMAPKKRDITKGSDKENAAPSFQTIAERRKMAQRRPKRKNPLQTNDSKAKKSMSSVFASIEKGSYESEEEQEEDEKTEVPTKDSSPSEDDEEDEFDESDEEEDEEQESDSDFDTKRKHSKKEPRQPKKKVRKTEPADEEEEDGEAKFDKILAFRHHQLKAGEKANDDNQFDFLIKYQNRSYLHLEWIAQEDVELVPGGKQRLTRLFKDADCNEDHPLFMAAEGDESKFYPADFVEVRLIYCKNSIDL